ncbi:hypothetical protein DVA86_03480 [Streptomyces armeniacus]|uniref:NB-ARC domain-containing protein n=1 Tax=Streptomyces armeniacus TaxID=83291 RepID=A0A345XZJ1_9ACTN|nr:hypothetical protein DVA86_03480 [Streptomyces armeniacus]
MAEHRLATVAGRAGVGKSRLAGDALAGLPDAPWQRVVRVVWEGCGPGEPGALAAAVSRSLAEPRRHPEAVGTGAGVRELARLLRGSETLLLLDDIDPVREECTGLVQSLLSAVPGLRVLVTSRQPLGLGEEHVLSLPPLSTEPPEAQSGDAPAVRLFLDRAAEAGHRVDRVDLPHVAAICRSLEGVPLSVELAAEQTSRHRLDDLAKQLERQQCWLSSSRPARPRHRSLRCAVSVSYMLCERTLRTVWARVSAVAGPFNESTAVHLCASGTVAGHQVPACLARLAALGVLVPVRDPGGLRQPRYRMVRAARDFGVERLKEAGEHAEAVQRRAERCRQVAALAERLWSSGSQPQAVHLVQEEQEELRAVLLHALDDPGQADVALDIVTNLWFWWVVYGRAQEGLDHLLPLLPLCPRDNPPTRSLWLAAWLTAPSDPDGARELLGRAWSTAILDGDDATLGRIAHVQGALALHRHDERAAAEHFHEAARTIPYRAIGGPSATLSLAAMALAQTGFDPRAARKSARRALTRRGIRADAWTCFVARYAMAYVDHRLGRHGRAWRRAQRALASLDGSLPAPYGTEALRRLTADIETSRRSSLLLRSVPLSCAVIPLPEPAGT